MFLTIALAVFLLTISVPFAIAQTNPANPIDNPIDNQVKGTPVLLGGEKLFVVKAQVGSFSAAERARAVTQRVEAIATDVAISTDTIKVEDQKYETTIKAGDQLLFNITDIDAQFTGKPRSQLADEYVAKLRTAIRQYRQEHSSGRSLSHQETLQHIKEPNNGNTAIRDHCPDFVATFHRKYVEPRSDR